MPLTELVPLLRDLSDSDKLLLLHFLATELLMDSGLVPLPTHGEMASQGLHDSFEAAAVLAKALAEDKSSYNRADQVRFAFTEIDPNLGAFSTLPYLPLMSNFLQ